MRRALMATLGTVAGLVALLDYKSSGAIHQSHIALGARPPGAASAAPVTSHGTRSTAPTSAPTSRPSTPAAPAPAATSPAATSPAATAPATTAPGAAARNYLGTDVTYRFGDIQVEITVAGGRITNISIP